MILEGVLRYWKYAVFYRFALKQPEFFHTDGFRPEFVSLMFTDWLRRVQGGSFIYPGL